MKSIRCPLIVLLATILSACQSQATPTVVSQTGTISNPSPSANKTQPVAPPSATTPATTPGTSTPAIHSSSSNPNASNLIVVQDQTIANKSLYITTVVAAQAGWIVLYFDKGGQPAELITYVPVPAGKSDHLAIPLSNLKNPVIQFNSIPGRQLILLLTAGTPAPGSPVQINNKPVMVSFTILAP